MSHTAPHQALPADHCQHSINGMPVSAPARAYPEQLASHSHHQTWNLLLSSGHQATKYTNHAWHRQQCHQLSRNEHRAWVMRPCLRISAWWDTIGHLLDHAMLQIWLPSHSVHQAKVQVRNRLFTDSIGSIDSQSDRPFSHEMWH